MTFKKVFFVRRSYRIDGGAESALKAYISAYIGLGFECSLVAEKWSGPSVDQLTTIRHVAVSGLSRYEKLKKFTERAAAEIAQLSHEYLTQSHEWVPGCHILRLGDGLHSTWVEKYLVTRGFLPRLFFRISRFHKYKLKMERDCLADPKLKYVIVNSEMVKKDLVTKYPLVTDKVRLIRNVPSIGISLEALPHKTARYTFGFAGSGWERKGLKFVLKALSLIDDTTLIIAGKDKKARKYRRIVEQLGISGRVVFAGVFSDMAKFYCDIQVLVHPAIYDPSPNVAIEALCYGIPVVCSQDTGTSDFAENCGVFTISRLCEKHLAEEMRRALALRIDVREDISNKMKRYNERYLSSALADLLGEVR